MGGVGEGRGGLCGTLSALGQFSVNLNLKFKM